MNFNPPTTGEMSTSVFGFFGLRENPFSINPNPRFLYLTPLTQAASRQLLDGIRERKGLIVLTGEVGTGKTLLLRRLLDWLTEQKMPTALIFNSHVNPDHLLDFILSDFGIRCDSDFKSDKLIALNNWLLERFRAGQTPVLIIDEAQGLPLQALEEVRLLLNLETPRQKLLQVVLAGQPELEDKLRRHELRQLRQRITVRCRTAPLTMQEAQSYIQSRLLTAGAKAPIFQPEAAAAVHAYARGIPRVMNLICEHSLINACAENSRVVSPEFVERAAHDCQLDQIESVSRILSSNYPACASSDEINSIFAGMSFGDSPSTQAHAAAAADTLLPPNTALLPDEAELAGAVNDSLLNSPTTALADPFSGTELPPSTDLAALGEYPAATPPPTRQDESAYDRRISFNGHQDQVAAPSSQLTAAQPHSGISPATISLFRAWWESFLEDARATARQLYALSRMQTAKLRPYARDLAASLESLRIRALQLASDPRWKAWRDRALVTVQQTYEKISIQARNRFHQFTAGAKAHANLPSTPREHCSEHAGLPPRSKMNSVRRWLREPFAPPANKTRNQNRSTYRRRTQ